MQKNLLSLLLAILFLFWTAGTTSYSQEKTGKAPIKTEKVIKKTSAKANVKKEKVGKASVTPKGKMVHKRHMKSEKMHKWMKRSKKTSSTEKEKRK